MIYYDIKNKLNDLITFSLHDIYMVDPEFRQSTLYNWEKAGQVIKLKRNNYVFSDFNAENLDYYLLSNLLYEPSYVSTELALNHYGVIPESVSVITAVSSNKTKQFSTKFGIFSYQSIKSDLLFGYELIEVRNRRVKLASLEKAVLDYLYLHSEIKTVEDFKSLRWNKQILNQELDMKKFQDYLAIFDTKVLNNRVKILLRYL